MEFYSSPQTSSASEIQDGGKKFRGGLCFALQGIFSRICHVGGLKYQWMTEQLDLDEVTMTTCGYPNEDLRDLSHGSQLEFTWGSLEFDNY